MTDQPEPRRPKIEIDLPRCRGTKRDGTRCTRHPKDGSGYCWEHR